MGALAHPERMDSPRRVVQEICQEKRAARVFILMDLDIRPYRVKSSGASAGSGGSSGTLAIRVSRLAGRIIPILERACVGRLRSSPGSLICCSSPG